MGHLVSRLGGIFIPEMGGPGVPPPPVSRILKDLELRDKVSPYKTKHLVPSVR